MLRCVVRAVVADVPGPRASQLVPSELSVALQEEVTLLGNPKKIALPASPSA